MKANIKGDWIEYNYCLNCCHTAVNSVLLELKKRYPEVKYLGGSKAIMIDETVEQLNSRWHFFYIKDYKPNY